MSVVSNCSLVKLYTYIIRAKWFVIMFELENFRVYSMFEFIMLMLNSLGIFSGITHVKVNIKSSC